MKRHLAIGAIVILATALGAGGGALAERAPYAVPLDTRIRTVAFEKDNVVVVYGTIGVSTMIVLGNDERIATVASATRWRGKRCRISRNAICLSSRWIKPP